MATYLGSALCDNSTLANFIAWAQPISTALGTTAGWLQSSDTGQVNWSTISAPPGSAAYVYEVWQPNDGLANFYLKIEYGNFTGTNSPTVRLTIGTVTNGAGTLIGSVVGPFTTNLGSIPTSTSTPYECRFSGAPGRFHAMLWRLSGLSTQFFSVERSVNSAGTYTSTHVTLITAGGTTPSGGAQNSVNQQTLHLTLGPAPAQSIANNGAIGGLAARLFYPGNTTSSGVFNGSAGFDTVSPYVGYFDWPLTGVGLGNENTYTEGMVFTTTLYGATRTYITTLSGRLANCGALGSASSLCMRYD
jgi:hypothetical protein